LPWFYGNQYWVEANPHFFRQLEIVQEFSYGLLRVQLVSGNFAKSHTAYNLLKWAGVIFLVVVSIQTLFTLKNEFGKFDLTVNPIWAHWPHFG
jgi:hypothetical protein